jgi:hypothetical protein
MFRSSRASSKPPGRNSSSSSSKGRSAGQQLRLHKQTAPAQQGPAAAADSSDGGSSSSSSSRGGRAAAAADRKQRLDYFALVFSRPRSSLDGQYSSSEDSVALTGNLNTVRDASDAYSAYVERCGRLVHISRLFQQQQQDPPHQQQSQVTADGLQLAHDEFTSVGAAYREAAAACGRQMQLSPQAEEFKLDALLSITAGPQPPSSASSAGWESSGGEGSNQGSPRLQGDALVPRSAAATELQGFRSAQEQQQRQQQRQLRDAVRHKWGPRSWHVRRATLLVRRQMMLNKLSLLQGAAVQALRNARTFGRACVAAAPAAQPGYSGAEQQGCWLLPCPGPAQLLHAVFQLLLRRLADSGRILATPSASNDREVVLHLRLVQVAPVQQPLSGSLVPAADQLLQHVAPTVTACEENGLEVSRVLHDATVRYSGQRKRLKTLAGACSEGGGAQGTAGAGKRAWLSLGHAAVGSLEDGLPVASSAVRLLLWEVLSTAKPSACHWYKTAAAYHEHLQRKQSKGGKQGGSSAAAAAASAEATGAHVPESASAGLWSTLTSSLASDLLLVPPSIRDLVGNGWAAGAGRLQGPEEGYTSSSSSSASPAGVGARMLLVQYARAVRRQYAKVSGNTWCLLHISRMWHCYMQGDLNWMVLQSDSSSVPHLD